MQELDDITLKLKQKLVISHVPVDYSSPAMTPAQSVSDTVTMTTSSTQPHSDLVAMTTASVQPEAVVMTTTASYASQYSQAANSVPKGVQYSNLHDTYGSVDPLTAAAALDSQTLPAYMGTPGRRPQLYSAQADFVSSPRMHPPPQPLGVATSKPETEVSIYTQTLQNAQNLLQSINHQADVMSSAARSLSGSGQSLPGSGQGHGADLFQHGAINQPVYSTSHLVDNEGNFDHLRDQVDAPAHDVDVLDGGIVENGGDGEEDDDTFDQVWKQYENNQLSRQLASDVSDIDSDEANVVLPRPLNDISSANFMNGATNYQPDVVDATVSETAHADDSFFGIPVPKAVCSDSVASYAAPDLEESGPPLSQQSGSVHSTSKRRLSYEVGEAHPRVTELRNGHADLRDDYSDQENVGREISDRDESSPGDDVRDFQRHSRSGYGYNQPDSDSDHFSEPAVIEPELRDEDPTHLKRVSRTSLNSDLPQGQSGRQAAMFRREYQRHRAGSSSSDEEEEERLENRSGPRRRRRKKKTNDTNSPTDQLEYEERIAEQQDRDAASDGFEAVDQDPEVNNIGENLGSGSEDIQSTSTLRNEDPHDRSVGSSPRSQQLNTQESANGVEEFRSDTASHRSALSARSVLGQRNGLEEDVDNLTPRSQLSQREMGAVSDRSHVSGSVKSHGSGSVRSHGSGSVVSHGSVKSHASGSTISHGSAKSHESGSGKSHGSVSSQGSRSVRSRAPESIRSHESGSIHSHHSELVEVASGSVQPQTNGKPVTYPLQYQCNRCLYYS